MVKCPYCNCPFVSVSQEPYANVVSFRLGEREIRKTTYICKACHQSFVKVYERDLTKPISVKDFGDFEDLTDEEQAVLLQVEKATFRGMGAIDIANELKMPVEKAEEILKRLENHRSILKLTYRDRYCTGLNFMIWGDRSNLTDEEQAVLLQVEKAGKEGTYAAAIAKELKLPVKRVTKILKRLKVRH